MMADVHWTVQPRVSLLIPVPFVSLFFYLLLLLWSLRDSIGRRNNRPADYIKDRKQCSWPSCKYFRPPPSSHSLLFLHPRIYSTAIHLRFSLVVNAHLFLTIEFICESRRVQYDFLFRVWWIPRSIARGWLKNWRTRVSKKEVEIEEWATKFTV